MKLIALGLLVLTAACGGAVDPAFDGGTVPEITVEMAPDAGSDAAQRWHFVCVVSEASTYWTEECTTLPDGAPSYTDTQAGIDCRTYLQGAGQGCIAPMSCQAWIDGELETGECMNMP